MRISDWSSDVCSSDLRAADGIEIERIAVQAYLARRILIEHIPDPAEQLDLVILPAEHLHPGGQIEIQSRRDVIVVHAVGKVRAVAVLLGPDPEIGRAS